MKTATKREVLNAEIDAMVYLALRENEYSIFKEASDIVNWIERKMWFSGLKKQGYRAVLRSLDRMKKKRFVWSYGRNQQCATIWYLREKVNMTLSENNNVEWDLLY